jgi:hypothetical protein
VGFCLLKGKCLNALLWLPRFLVIWDVPSLLIIIGGQNVRNVYFIKKGFHLELGWGDVDWIGLARDRNSGGLL